MLLLNSFQIEKWLNMFEHFERLDNYHVISEWLLIDQRPFKHYVLNQCSKWGNLYKDHLLNYVLNSLNVSIHLNGLVRRQSSGRILHWKSTLMLVTHPRHLYLFNSHFCMYFNRFAAPHYVKELEQFIETSDEILSLKFEWDDFGALLRIMTALKSIREREARIETLFPSLKKIIYMLLQYSVRVPKKCSIQVGKFVLTNYQCLCVCFKRFLLISTQADSVENMSTMQDAYDENANLEIFI